MKNHNLAFVDLETTGLEAGKHEIIEIGCIIVKQAPALIGGPKVEVIEEFLLKVRPQHIETADPQALKINGYNKVDWKDAISLKEAMEIFTDKTKGSAFIAQNACFDWMFLIEAFRSTGVENKMHYHRLDIISFAFAKLYDKTDAQKFSLRALCKYFGIRNEKEHSALADIRATLEVYKKLIEM